MKLGTWDYTNRAVHHSALAHYLRLSNMLYNNFGPVFKAQQHVLIIVAIVIQCSLEPWPAADGDLQ